MPKRHIANSNRPLQGRGLKPIIVSCLEIPDKSRPSHTKIQLKYLQNEISLFNFFFYAIVRQVSLWN